MEEKEFENVGSTESDNTEKIAQDSKKEEKRVGVNFSKLLSRKERRAEARKNKVDFIPHLNGGVVTRVKTKTEIKIIMNKIARDQKIQARGVTN